MAKSYYVPSSCGSNIGPKHSESSSLDMFFDVASMSFSGVHPYTYFFVT